MDLVLLCTLGITRLRGTFDTFAVKRGTKREVRRENKGWRRKDGCRM
jgi:hypothetical protein